MYSIANDKTVFPRVIANRKKEWRVSTFGDGNRLTDDLGPIVRYIVNCQSMVNCLIFHAKLNSYNLQPIVDYALHNWALMTALAGQRIARTENPFFLRRVIERK